MNNVPVQPVHENAPHKSRKLQQGDNIDFQKYFFLFLIIGIIFLLALY